MSSSRIFAAVVALSLLACTTSHAREQSASSARPAEGFSSLVARGFATVHVEVGPRHSVIVACNDGDGSWVRTDVEAGALQIDSRADGRFVPRALTCNVDVTLPELVSVESHGSGALAVKGRAPGLGRVFVKGSGSARIESAESDRLAVTLFGSGAIELREVVARITSIEVDGSGGLRIAGKSPSVVLKVQGSGDIDARELSAEDCTLSAHGSSSSNLFASRRAAVDLFGSGNAFIAGHPTERLANVHGSGQVRWQ